jgi:hypothetical protein
MMDFQQPGDEVPTRARTRSAQRWPGVLVSTIVGVTAATVCYRTLEQAMNFGTGDDDYYTRWVAKPVFEGYAWAAVISLATIIVLLFRRWGRRTRTVVSTLSTVAAVVLGLLGFHESQARRHIGPALVRAIGALAAPPGVIPLGPTQLSVGGGYSEADRSWRLPIPSQEAACTAARHMVEGQPGWESTGECTYQRAHGRVLLTIGFDGPGAPTDYDIHVRASAYDGSG